MVRKRLFFSRSGNTKDGINADSYACRVGDACTMHRHLHAPNTDFISASVNGLCSISLSYLIIVEKIDISELNLEIR